VTDARSDRSASHPGVVLAIVCSAQLVLAVDITVILVANVQIKDALGFSEAGLTWIVTAYALTYGGLLLLAGRLGDAWGHRRVFLLGLIAFGLASAGAAAATNPASLVTFRAVQGAAAAFVSPAALALLGHEFPDGARRTRAFGWWAASGSAGGVLGYTLGGLLVGSLGWRWAFLINVPIVAGGVCVAIRALPRTHPGGRARLPVLGAMSVTAGLSLVIYAVTEAESDGWSAPPVSIALGLAVVGLVLFTVHELRSPEPLIPLPTIRRREFLVNVPAAGQAATIGAAVFLGSLYLQQVLGYSPQQVGVATLPIPLGVAAGAFIANRTLRRRPQLDRQLVVGGSTLVALALLGIGVGTGRGSYAEVLLPAWAVLGAGLAISSVPLTSIATGGSSAADRGGVAGAYNMAQQVGTAVGLAVLTTIAVSNGSGSSDPVSAVHGIRVAMTVTAGLALATAVFAGLVLRRPVGALAPPDELLSLDPPVATAVAATLVDVQPPAAAAEPA
jgi:EmrB/QacA subfamily drug resistance transporter